MMYGGGNKYWIINIFLSKYMSNEVIYMKCIPDIGINIININVHK